MQDLENLESLLYFQKGSSCSETVYNYMIRAGILNANYNKENSFTEKYKLISNIVNNAKLANTNLNWCEEFFNNFFNNFNTDFSNFIKENFEPEANLFFKNIKNGNYSFYEFYIQNAKISIDATELSDNYIRNSTIPISIEYFQLDLSNLDILHKFMQKTYTANYNEVDTINHKLELIEQIKNSSSQAYSYYKLTDSFFDEFFKGNSTLVKYLKKEGFDTDINNFFENLDKQQQSFNEFDNELVGLINSGNNLLDNYINNMGW